MLAQTRLAGWQDGWIWVPHGHGIREEKGSFDSTFFSVFGLYIFVIPFVCSDFLCGLEGRKEVDVQYSTNERKAWRSSLSCLALSFLSYPRIKFHAGL